MWAPPFALQFSKGPSRLRTTRGGGLAHAVSGPTGAKAGGRQLFAVADEEGTIGLINGSEDSHDDQGAFRAGRPFALMTEGGSTSTETGRTSFKAHHNAIFDLAWSADDSMLVRAHRSRRGDEC